MPPKKGKLPPVIIIRPPELLFSLAAKVIEDFKTLSVFDECKRITMFNIRNVFRGLDDDMHNFIHHHLMIVPIQCNKTCRCFNYQLRDYYAHQMNQETQQVEMVVKERELVEEYTVSDRIIYHQLMYGEVDKCKVRYEEKIREEKRMREESRTNVVWNEWRFNDLNMGNVDAGGLVREFFGEPEIHLQDNSFPCHCIICLLTSPWVNLRTHLEDVLPPPPSRIDKKQAVMKNDKLLKQMKNKPFKQKISPMIHNKKKSYR